MAPALSERKGREAWQRRQRAQTRIWLGFQLNGMIDRSRLCMNFSTSSALCRYCDQVAGHSYTSTPRRYRKTSWRRVAAAWRGSQLVVDSFELPSYRLVSEALVDAAWRLAAALDNLPGAGEAGAERPAHLPARWCKRLTREQNPGDSVRQTERISARRALSRESRPCFVCGTPFTRAGGARVAVASRADNGAIGCGRRG
jgi:hypothetical protein